KAKVIPSAVNYKYIQLALTKCGRINEALRTVPEAKRNKVQITAKMYNNLIFLCSKFPDKHEEILVLYDEILQNQMPLDKGNMPTVLPILCSKHREKEATAMFAQAKEFQVHLNKSSYMALLKLYSECKHIG